MDLVAFEDGNLEELRRLITLKETVASDTFATLTDGIDNDALGRAFERIQDAAAQEHAELADILQTWMHAGGARHDPDVAARDIVHQWADIHEAAARRLRSSAAYAPTHTLRDRLRRLAARDEAHARSLRNLL